MWGLVLVSGRIKKRLLILDKFIAYGRVMNFRVIYEGALETVDFGLIYEFRCMHCIANDNIGRMY